MSAARLADPVKFDFGETFDSLVPGEFDGPDAKEKTWTDAEMEQERAEAFAKGVEQGRAEALASLEQRISDAASLILDRTQAFESAVSDTKRVIEEDARVLALTVGRKFSSELLVLMREQHIEALVSDAIGLLTEEPHVVIRVNEEMLDGLRERFELIAQQRGYRGNLIMLGEPDLSAADCTIEWADGGIRRNTAELEAEMDEIVRRHLHQSMGETDEEPIEAPHLPEEADNEGNT